MALEQQIETASWRQEQLLNRVRVGLWGSIGGMTWVSDTLNQQPDGLGPAFVAYALACAAWGYVVLSKRHPRWWSTVSTIIDVTVVVLCVAWLLGGRLSQDPTTRSLTFTGQVTGLMLVLAANALRLSPWPAILTGSYAVVAHLSARFWFGAGLDPYGVVDTLLLAGEAAMLSLAAGRNRQLTLQLLKDMRELYDHRVQTMGRLVAGTAHELNTPLGVLRSGLSTVTKGLERLGREPERAARSAEAVRSVLPPMDTAVERIREVVGALVHFARVDESRMQEFDVHEGLESAMTLLRGQTPQLRFRLSLDPVPVVRGHPALLNQILLDLLRNSSESAGEEGTIEVSCRHEDPHVLIRIDDDGPGLTAQAAKRLFEPTFRRDGARVRMGLGLAVSRSIAQDHGGDLFLETSREGGNSIILALPAVDGGEAGENRGRSSPRAQP